MSEAEADGGDSEAVSVLRARAEALEQQLVEAEIRSAVQLRQSDLKAEAARAGILDMDGLRLLDPDVWAGRVDSGGGGASEVIAKLRREKPWLFGASHSSSVATAPIASPARRRLATDMSLEEWRAARADLLRRR